MSDEVPASISFDVRFMRKDRHSALIFLPESYHAPIGLVIAHWGNFETAFDTCLQALIDGEAADGGTRIIESKASFKHRRTLFKAICAEWLSTWQPQEAEVLAKIADTAGDLSSKRNILAHGRYTYKIRPHSSAATECRAISNSKGREFSFDADVLIKLYHDISHLTADLLLSFNRFGQVDGPFHALPDTEILRLYRQTPHPWNPSPSKRTSSTGSPTE